MCALVQDPNLGIGSLLRFWGFWTPKASCFSLQAVGLERVAGTNWLPWGPYLYDQIRGAPSRELVGDGLIPQTLSFPKAG